MELVSARVVDFGAAHLLRTDFPDVCADVLQSPIALFVRSGVVELLEVGDVDRKGCTELVGDLYLPLAFVFFPFGLIQAPGHVNVASTALAASTAQATGSCKKAVKKSPKGFVANLELDSLYTSTE